MLLQTVIEIVHLRNLFCWLLQYKQLDCLIDWLIGWLIDWLNKGLLSHSSEDRLFWKCFSLLLNKKPHTHTHTRTNTLPFYGSLSVTTRVGRYRKRHSPTHTWNVLWESVVILDFMRRGEDNRGKCVDNPAGHHPIWIINAPTSIIHPSCCNPSNLFWLRTGTRYAGLRSWRLG